MRLRFTKLTNELHRFEIVRDDGSREVSELATRSFLIHDLTHYAVEVEAQLTGSLYGRLARGVSYDSFISAPPAWLSGDFIARVRERLRRVQGHWRDTISPNDGTRFSAARCFRRA